MAILVGAVTVGGVSVSMGLPALNTGAGYELVESENTPPGIVSNLARAVRIRSQPWT
jgi:hypothetical protein